MKIHDVTPEFVAKVKQLASLQDVSPEELVRLRIHDVTPDYIEKAKSGRQDISLEDIIRMKTHGGREARL